jgi:hypothetical protein
VDTLQRIAELPAIRDLDRIIAEGLHLTGAEGLH